MSYRHNTVRKNELVVNVKDYGAVGDGVANDRAAIHAARDAAGVGGTLWFPPGTYRINVISAGAAEYKFGSAGLVANVAGQTWLLNNSTIRWGAYNGWLRENLITVAAPNVSIIGGTLDLSVVPADLTNRNPRGAGVAVWSGQVTSGGLMYGAHGSGSAGAMIRDVTINDCAGSAVHILNTSSVTVTGCVMNNAFVNGVFVYNGASEAISDFLIEGNYIESSWKSFAAGLGIGGNDQSPADFLARTRRIKRARITNNTIILPRPIYPGQPSFFVGGAEAGAIESMNLEDSVIDGNTTEGSAFGITTAFFRNCVISNNTCTGFRGIGIEIGGGEDNLSVVGNTINADGAGGPYNIDTGLQDPAGTLLTTGTSGILGSGSGAQFEGLPTLYKNISIVGNSITGLSTSVAAAGIVFHSAQAKISGLTIAGNSIKGDGTSSTFTGVNLYINSENVTVTGNSFDGGSHVTGHGVRLNGGFTHTGHVISGNNFANCATAAATLEGTLTDLGVSGNLIRNCGARIAGNGIPTATRVITDATLPLTSTETAAGTTTLTTDSTEVQRFTGTSTQTVRLPTTNVIAGQKFTVINSSTGSVTVQSSNTNTVATLTAGTSATFIALQAAPTTSAHWHNLKV